MTPAKGGNRRLRILIAEDDAATRALLRSFLQRQGHEVMIVSDGQKALARFEHSRSFDLFIIDVTMPIMDGLTLCSEIKKRLEHWVPIIMISANARENDQVQGLDIGADYYLTKPISFPLLKASLAASRRIAALYGDLREKSEALQSYFNRSQADNDLARDLLARIFHGDEAQVVNAQYMISPVGEFSGDMIVSMQTPALRHYSFVADATGHGLPAALTLMPAVETFYRLAKDGFSLSVIARELNHRLRASLPRDRFIAASLIMIEPYSRRIEVWNGGNPPVYLFNAADRAIVERFPSQHPPLGILDDHEFRSALAVCAYDRHHSLVACTDGIVEVESRSGEMFGKAGLEAVMTDPARAEDLTESTNQALNRFSGGGAAQDDRTLLVLPLNSFEYASLIDDTTEAASPGRLPTRTRPVKVAKGSWQFSVGVRGETLRQAELSPLVNNLLAQVGLTGQNADRAYVCVTELINNAVDHGVLQLDSSLKSSPEGFEQYFQERRKRLDALSRGGIDIWASLEQFEEYCLLSVSVSDSGVGFIPGDKGNRLPGAEKPSGRGIRLVTELSDHFGFQNGGATAEFQIVLESQPAAPGGANATLPITANS